MLEPESEEEEEMDSVEAVEAGTDVTVTLRICRRCCAEHTVDSGLSRA